MLTEIQKRTAQAIVNVFETGRPRGEYGRVTVLEGDTGHLTYGRAQTTLASGNLFLLVKAYVETPDAGFAAALEPFLERLAARDTRLDRHLTLQDTLRRAGADPVMREVQDGFFDRVYWEPSLRSADHTGLSTALGVGVVYDSRIHGSWPRMRDRTIERHGNPGAIGERDWVRRYLDTRREWLANHANPWLPRTVYRMDALAELAAADKWSLELPITVRGVLLDRSAVTGDPTEDAVRPSAGDGDRLLRAQDPPLEGEDVRRVQEVLEARGASVEADGVYGLRTAAAVRTFQRRHGLVDDGIVGPATRAALGLES